MTSTNLQLLWLARSKLTLLGDHQRGEDPEREAQREHYRQVVAELSHLEPVPPPPPETDYRLPYKDDD